MMNLNISLLNLRELHKILVAEYFLYKHGKISEKEYLIRANSLDIALSKLKMSTLLDTLVWKVTSLKRS